MPNKNGKITAPVSLIDDVRAVLEEQAIDIVSLCTSPKVNKFSKCKPYAQGRYLPLDDNYRYEVNYGLDLRSEYTNIKIDAENETVTIPTWGQWSPPVGYPCRLSDFNGYNHNARPYVRGVKINTSHIDGESIILSNTEKGYINIQVALNLDAELKYSDFHLEGQDSNVKFGDMYMCAALVPIRLLPSGENYNVYAYSQKMSEFENTYYDAIELTLQTAPHGTLLDAMSIYKSPLILIIGLVRNTNSPTVFYSPIIFKEWESFPWKTTYTTYEKWNGQQVRYTRYFVGGLYLPYNDTLSYSFQRRGTQVYELHIAGLDVAVRPTDAAGNIQQGSTAKFNLNYDGYLEDGRGNVVSIGGNINIDSNNRFIEDYILNTLSFPTSGNWSGKVRFEVVDKYIYENLIDGAYRQVTHWVRLGDWGVYTQSLERTLSVNVV